jgi:DNA repair exonuclease SbcCD ATPase subunit
MMTTPTKPTEAQLREALLWLEAGRGFAGQVKALQDAIDELVAARVALEVINGIRNSVVGLQRLSWSEHIYPLVAALDAAGMEGLDYPEARANVGTLLERLATAQRERDEARAELKELRSILVWWNENVGDLEKIWSALLDEARAQRDHYHDKVEQLTGALQKIHDASEGTVEQLKEARAEIASLKAEVQVAWADCHDGSCRACAKCFDALQKEVERLKGQVRQHLRSFEGHVYIKNETWAEKCDALRQLEAQRDELAEVLRAVLADVERAAVQNVIWSDTQRAVRAVLAKVPPKECRHGSDVWEACADCAGAKVGR